MPAKIIGIGDNVVDKYLHLHKMFPGGQALNVAVFVRQLGLPSAYIGVFGDDGAAAHIIATLGELGVDISRCRHVKGENGYAVVDLIDGERKFIRSNKGGVSREFAPIFDEDDLSYIKKFNLIHTSNNSFIDGEIPKLAGTGVPISYDFSDNFTPERLDAICPHLRFAFLSCSALDEGEVKELLEGICRRGCSTAVATRGALGAICCDRGAFYSCFPIPTKPVDTLGAGDAFTAGFLAGVCSGADITNGEPISPQIIKIAMEAGSRQAYEACQTFGAFGRGADIK